MNFDEMVWPIVDFNIHTASDQTLQEFNLSRNVVTRTSVTGSHTTTRDTIQSLNMGNRNNSKLAFRESGDGLTVTVGSVRILQTFMYRAHTNSTISEYLWYSKQNPSAFWLHLEMIMPARIKPEDKAELKLRILDRARQAPFSLLTWHYLNKWRKRLNITKLDLQNATGIHWFNGSLGPVPSAVRFGANSTWQIINNSFCAVDLFSNFGQIQTPEAPLIIERYSTKVEHILPVNTSRTKIVGIELELTAKGGDIDAALQYAHRHLRTHAIFKSDGSVPNGFETVTIPELSAVHKKVLQPFFEEGLADLMEATSNCGIHVHMTRKGLSFLQLGRMLELLNRTENQGYISKVAGRTSSYALPDPGNTLKHVAYHFNNQSYNFGNRYSILNLQNQNTVELRAFKSTTDFKELCRFLEFADAIRDYTTTGVFNKSVKEPMKWEDFVTWVNSQRKEYPNLVTFHKGL